MEACLRNLSNSSTLLLANESVNTAAITCSHISFHTCPIFKTEKKTTASSTVQTEGAHKKSVYILVMDRNAIPVKLSLFLLTNSSGAV